MRGLTREKIVTAGLTLIDQDSADAVTMRGLAHELGVTPMALYNHFANKRDLLRAIAESVIGDADFDGRRADWPDQIRHCFRTLRAICLQHPGLPRLLEIEGAAPASALAPIDVAVRSLEQAGLDHLDCVRTGFILVGFTLSQAAYQTRGPFPDLESSPRSLTGWDFDASFEFGLTLILTGVAELVRQRRED